MKSERDTAFRAAIACCITLAALANAQANSGVAPIGQGTTILKGVPWSALPSTMANCPTTGCAIEVLGGNFTATGAITFPSGTPVTVQLGPGTITGPCPLFNLSSAANGSALLGYGLGDVAFLGGNYGTELVCTSGSGSGAIVIGNGASHAASGLRVENIAVNCNSAGAYGFVFDTVETSHFSDLAASNCTAIGFWWKVSATAANINNSWNYFGNIYSRNSPISVQLDGDSTGDFTQNLVENLSLAFTGIAGLNINSSDNAWFYGIQTFRTSGAGYGIKCMNPGSTTGCSSNFFFGTIGGVAGVPSIYIDCGTYGNEFYGYDVVNGETAPALCSTSGLSYKWNGQMMSGPAGGTSPSGTDQGWTHWLYAQGEVGNPPNGNPSLLNSGMAFARDFSNGLGEGDVFVNIGSGSGAGGLVRFYHWNGSTASLYATLPNSAIGNIVGDAATQTLANKTLTSPTTNRLQRSGSAPTCSWTNGGGTGATCSVYSGTDMAGEISLTAGTNPSSTGNITLTFSSPFPTAPICIYIGNNGAGHGWPPGSSFTDNGTTAASSLVGYSYNGTFGSSGDVYRLNYICM